MTTFKTVVRRKRADGFYPVYIRVVHRTKMGWKSHSTLTLLATQNYPFWLKYD